jgi:hypothetical protein
MIAAGNAVQRRKSRVGFLVDPAQSIQQKSTRYAEISGINADRSVTPTSTPS